MGELLYRAGESGISWRIRSGSVRLDQPDPRHPDLQPVFAGIALPGDILGAEAMLFGHYAFNVHALSDVSLDQWLEPSTDSLLASLESAHRRTADTVRVRSGVAIERVRQLLLLLSRAGKDKNESASTSGALVIPSLRDMSEITDLTQETVSRSVSRLRKLGVLQRYSQRSGVLDVSRLESPIGLTCVA
jgi:CRP-like cAMP-binding protein